jgi:hypothetical protein
MKKDISNSKILLFLLDNSLYIVYTIMLFLALMLVYILIVNL